MVLGVSLGQSAVYSVLRIIERLTRPEPLAQQTSTLNASATPDRPWLDLTYQLVGIGFGADAGAARPLPAEPAAPTGRRDDRPRPPPPGFDLGFGALVALGIGIPGLGLYLGARELGLEHDGAGLGAGRRLVDGPGAGAVRRAELAAGGGGHDRLPVHPARRAGLAAGRRSCWSAPCVRGAYHLYQGFGGFVGNLIMGVIFGLIYLRWKRVGPLVVGAHPAGRGRLRRVRPARAARRLALTVGPVVTRCTGARKSCRRDRGIVLQRLRRAHSGASHAAAPIPRSRADRERLPTTLVGYGSKRAGAWR